MEKDVEINLRKAMSNLEKSVETKIQKNVEKQEKKLEQSVVDIQNKQILRQEDINKKKSEEFTELTYDIIFDLLRVADELLDNVSKGRVGQNLNFKLLQLYNRVVEYRKKLGSSFSIHNKTKCCFVG